MIWCERMMPSRSTAWSRIVMAVIEAIWPWSTPSTLSIWSVNA